MENLKYQFPEIFVNEETRMIQRMVRDFVNKEIMPVRHLLDDDDDMALTNKIMQGLVDLGLQRMFIPEEYGGSGLHSAVTSYIISEELARGDLGISASFGCLAWALRPAIMAKNRTVLEKFAPQFCGSEVKFACYNMTEPGGPHGGGGFDIENPYEMGKKLRTIAKLEGNEWIVNGSKLWPTNAGIACLNCVPCTIDPKLGGEGIVFIYIPEPWPGVTHGRFENKAGVRTSRNCATYFDNVKVPKEWGIGPGGEAAKLFYAQLGGALSCAFAAGVMQGAFEAVLEYTGNRIVGGKPIRQHSLAARIIGEMAMQVETARLWYLTSAYMADHPEIYGPSYEGFLLARNNMARLFGTQAVVKLTNDAINLMGGHGYVRENHVEKYWRDGKALQLWLGGVYLFAFNTCRGYYDLNL
jgi:butyryl-CoA dehydrogenase